MTVRLSGDVATAEVKAAIRDLYEGVESGADGRRLWDMRTVTRHLSSEEVRELSEYLRTFGDERRGRVALLAGDDYAFGVAREFQGRAGDAAVELAVFRREDEALAWLREDRPA